MRKELKPFVPTPHIPLGVRAALRDLKAILLGAALGLLLSPPAYADAFNHIVRKDFKWRVVYTTHFEIYYYEEAAPLLSTVARVLERNYTHNVQDLGIRPGRRVPFFLYISQEDFEQNNIAFVNEATGGVTEAFKNRFVIPHLGSEFWLERVIRHEFTHVLEFEQLFGGFWKSARLLKFPFYPLWLMEGLAEYETEELDGVMREMVIRDAYTAGLLPPLRLLHNFGHLKPHYVTLAYKTGQKVLQFIAQEYGKDKVVQALKAFQDRFDSGTVLREVVGADLPEFDAKFREHLAEQYDPLRAIWKDPEAYGQPLTHPDILPSFHTHPVFSPDGKTLAFLSDRKGYDDIVFLDLETGRERPLNVRRFHNHFDRFGGGLLSGGGSFDWSPDGRTLVFIGVKALQQYLYFYDIPRDHLRKIKMDFQRMSSPVFMPGGQHVLLVGMRETLTDLYRCDLQGKNIERLTQDAADDSDPSVSRDGRWVVYSSEKIVPKDPVRPQQRKLFLFNMEDRSIQPLTDLPLDQTSPQFSPDGKRVVFVSDHEGTYNLYQLDLETRAIVRLTQAMGGNFDPVYSPDGKSIAWSAYRRVERHLYRADPSRFENTPLPAKALAGSPPLPEDPGTRPESARLSNDHPFGWRDSFPSFLRTTDLFFPVLFFSSDSGLFVAGIWQASSMLGHHQFQATGQYASGGQLAGYSAIYTFGRFRPQFFAGAFGRNDYVDLRETIRRKEHAGVLGMSYPLDRFSSISIAALSAQASLRDEPTGAFYEALGNASVVSFSQDTVSGRYLVSRRGHRVFGRALLARPVAGGDLNYTTQQYEWHQFFPSPYLQESTLAMRLMSVLSHGRDREFFFLGGFSGVRGVARTTDDLASNLLILNTEYRFPVFRELNWHLWFLVPDILFKAIHGFVFTDVGYPWNSRSELDRVSLGSLRHTVGAGVRFYTFIFQGYPLILQLQGAQRLDVSDHEIFFTLGPVF